MCADLGSGRQEFAESFCEVGELYSGVEDGFLLGVEPGGWLPYGEAVGIQVAGPAFSQEVVVVVATQEGQVLQVGGAAVDPCGDVVESA
jgi:hypothetical protein